MPTLPFRDREPNQTAASALDASLSGPRAVLLALALTVSAAALGVGVSWAVERTGEPTGISGQVASIDKAARLAYSRSSARVSGDFGAP